MIPGSWGISSVVEHGAPHAPGPGVNPWQQKDPKTNTYNVLIKETYGNTLMKTMAMINMKFRKWWEVRVADKESSVLEIIWHFLTFI